MTESRAYTREEIQQQFLTHIRTMVEFWEGEPAFTVRRRLEGLAFSILVLLDGETSLPPFMVIPCANEEDKTYSEAEGENYYPPVDARLYQIEPMDIAGNLHEEFYRAEREANERRQTE